MAHIAAKAGIVALSAAIAAAVALYESPELRRHADEVRRRIATALHNLGDGITPPHRNPMFNRPEDAYAYWQGHAGPGAATPDGANPGVDADDETRRRQREELMYWNAIREQRDRERKAEFAASADGRPPPARGTSFDDFLQQDYSAGETGAYVYNSGADYRQPPTHGLVYRRGGEPARLPELTVPAASAVPLVPLVPLVPAKNPFADENRITDDENATMTMTPTTATMRDDATDIYSATLPDTDTDAQQAAAKSPEAAAEALTSSTLSMPLAETELPPTLERRLADDEFVTAGGDDEEDRPQHDAFASVQAWARDAQPGFYSPLPMSPPAPVSEPEVVSDFEGHEDGQLTPTDSVSLAGSGEDIANDAVSSRASESGRPFDVLSESEGMATPASWSEVGSVVSEGESWR